MNVRCSIFGILVAGLFTFTGVKDTLASDIPFKTLRVVSKPDATVFIGGAEFTVTRLSIGHYRIAFPVGTWNSGSAVCFYVPQVQTMFTSSAAEIVGYVTFANGSGSLDVTVLSGADAWLLMVFTSANC